MVGMRTRVIFSNRTTSRANVSVTKRTKLQIFSYIYDKRG